MRNNPDKIIIALFSFGIVLGALCMDTRSYALEAKNVRLVGYNDLEGRDSLQVVL